MALLEVLTILTFGIVTPSLGLTQFLVWKEDNNMAFNDVGKAIGGMMGYFIVGYAIITILIGYIT